MSAFGEQLREFMDREGVAGVEELFTSLAAVPRRRQDLPLSKDELEAMMRGEDIAREGMVIRCCGAAFKLTGYEMLQLAWAHYGKERIYPPVAGDLTFRRTV